MASERSNATAAAVDALQSPASRTSADDDFANLAGPLGDSWLLSLQRLAGNEATASLWQRKVETPGGWFGKNNLLGNWRNEWLLEKAANFIDNPVHKKCVYHYGRNKGAPLKLDRADMKAMNIQFGVMAWKPVQAAMKEAERELQDRFKDPEREQAGFPPVIPAGEEASRTVSAEGEAIANGSLAGCIAHIEGNVIVSKGDARFEGTVYITDRWDFDPAFISDEDKSHRTWMGEAQTIVGWGLLPGEPFPVTTETVNFTQQAGSRARLEL